MAAVAIVGAVMADKAANKAADQQTKALEHQNQLRADEIADSQGEQLTERTRAARRERAAARVSAAESGINLGSNSFLAMLQTSEINQSIDSGLILKNESNMQRARQAQHASNLAGIQKKTGLGIALDATQAGVQAYMGAGGQTYMGSKPGRG
jgi:hypothetical protein